MSEDPYALSGDLGDEHDDRAETEAALQAERDERDGAVSEEAAPTWARQAEFDSLGFMLAWWDEDDDVPPLEIAVDVAGNVCGKTGMIHKLVEHGYDSTAMTGTIALDSLSGPLVVAALQVLGTLHSHLREDVTKVLKHIFDAVPEASEEEMANLHAAYDALSAAQAEETKARFAEQGLEVLTFTDPEEALAAIESMIEQTPHEDSTLN